MVVATKIQGMDVVRAIRSAKTPGKKSAATKLRKAFIEQQEGEGSDPKWVNAWIESAITRLNNGN